MCFLAFTSVIVAVLYSSTEYTGRLIETACTHQWDQVCAECVSDARLVNVAHVHMIHARDAFAFVLTICITDSFETVLKNSSSLLAPE